MMVGYDLVYKQNTFQYLKGENSLERKQIVLFCVPMDFSVIQKVAG